MIRRLRGAAQFLTVVPFDGPAAPPGQAALFFPLVAAFIGWSGAGVYLIGEFWVGASIGALLTLTFWALITGGLHEDGLADVADAMRSGRSRERILAILKDSRIGAFGALAIVFSVMLRWQALTAISPRNLAVLVASQAVPRAAMVALAWISRPAGEGLGAEFCASLTTPVALAAIAQGVAAAAWCGLRVTLLTLPAAGLIVVLARRYFYRRIGGINGDCLGATSQVVETFFLVVVSCHRCLPDMK